MKDVLQSLKSVYQGENQLERHLWYFVLMILPAITGAFAGFIDKDTPKDWLPAIIVCTVIFGILSIFPLLCFIGIYIQYLKNRTEGKTGLPEMNIQLFMTGLKAFPLELCWGIYIFVLYFAICLAVIIPAIALIVLSFTAAPMLLITIPLLIIAFLVLCFALSFITIFVSYINIQYCEDFKLKGELFNPLLLCKYIKKTFKKTLIAACKYLLAAIIITAAAGIVTLVIGIIMFLTGVLTVGIAGHSDALVYAFIMMFAAIAALINFYTSAILGLGFSNRLIEIYKEIKTAD